MTIGRSPNLLLHGLPLVVVWLSLCTNAFVGKNAAQNARTRSGTLTSTELAAFAASNDDSCSTPKSVSLSSPMAAFCDDPYVLASRPCLKYKRVDDRPKPVKFTVAPDCDVVFDMNWQRAKLMALYTGDMKQRNGVAKPKATAGAPTNAPEVPLQPPQEEQPPVVVVAQAAGAVETKNDSESKESVLQKRIHEGPSFQLQSSKDDTEINEVSGKVILAYSGDDAKETMTAMSSKTEITKNDNDTVSTPATSTRPTLTKTKPETTTTTPPVLASSSHEATVAVQGGSRVSLRAMQQQDKIPFENIATAHPTLNCPSNNNSVEEVARESTDEEEEKKKLMALDEDFLVNEAFGPSNGADEGHELVAELEKSARLVTKEPTNAIDQEETLASHERHRVTTPLQGLEDLLPFENLATRRDGESFHTLDNGKHEKARTVQESAMDMNVAAASPLNDPISTLANNKKVGFILQQQALGTNGVPKASTRLNKLDEAFFVKKAVLDATATAGKKNGVNAHKKAPSTTIATKSPPLNRGNELSQLKKRSEEPNTVDDRSNGSVSDEKSLSPLVNSSSSDEKTSASNTEDLIVTGMAALGLAGLSAVVGVETLVDVALVGTAALALASSAKKRTNGRDESLIIDTTHWNVSTGNSTEISVSGAIKPGN